MRNAQGKVALCALALIAAGTVALAQPAPAQNVPRRRCR